MKKLIRLTESDLHKIVKESVQKIIKEAGIVGKISNFDPNKSYTNINGTYTDNQRIMDMAKEKLISIISKPFKISVSTFEGEGYGSFYEKTPDGWEFIAEDIPLDLIIDDYSCYEPETRYCPASYSNPKGHIENVETPTYIEFYPPSSSFKNCQIIHLDDAMQELFAKNVQDDGNLTDALLDKEEFEREDYDDCID